MIKAQKTMDLTNNKLLTTWKFTRLWTRTNEEGEAIFIGNTNELPWQSGYDNTRRCHDISNKGYDNSKPRYDNYKGKNDKLRHCHATNGKVWQTQGLSHLVNSVWNPLDLSAKFSAAWQSFSLSYLLISEWQSVIVMP